MKDEPVETIMQKYGFVNKIYVNETISSQSQKVFFT